jgi:hypothetical protein
MARHADPGKRTKDHDEHGGFTALVNGLDLAGASAQGPTLDDNAINN